MTTLQRLQDNQQRYEDEINDRMNEITAWTLEHPLRFIGKWMRRRERRALYEQREMVRSRYWVIKEETRRIIYKA